MQTNYPTIRHALETYSVELGLDDEAADKLLLRELGRPEWRQALETELSELLEDDFAPWSSLIENDDYQICEAEDDDNARRLVLELLWPHVFPNIDNPVFDSDSTTLHHHSPPQPILASVEQTKDLRNAAQSDAPRKPPPKEP